jgi:hypothetical protein
MIVSSRLRLIAAGLRRGQADRERRGQDPGHVAQHDQREHGEQDAVGEPHRDEHAPLAVPVDEVADEGPGDDDADADGGRGESAEPDRSGRGDDEHEHAHGHHRERQARDERDRPVDPAGVVDQRFVGARRDD